MTTTATSEPRREIRRVCNGKSKEHRDALSIVEFVMGEGGSTPLTNTELAVALGFTQRRGSIIEVDTARSHRARNHVKDRFWKDGKPCTGYRLHYREIKGLAHLCLIDETGDLGEHATAGYGQLMGWLVRERQHQTENLRQEVSLDALANHALSRGDKWGYRLCQRAIVELAEFGTIKSGTLAEMAVWIESIK